MTEDQALEVLADEVTGSALREVIENGLVDSHLEVELDDSHLRALRVRLEQRLATRPSSAALASAVDVLSRGTVR